MTKRPPRPNIVDSKHSRLLLVADAVVNGSTPLEDLGVIIDGERQVHIPLAPPESLTSFMEFVDDLLLDTASSTKGDSSDYGIVRLADLTNAINGDGKNSQKVRLAKEIKEAKKYAVQQTAQRMLEAIISSAPEDSDAYELAYSIQNNALDNAKESISALPEEDQKAYTHVLPFLSFDTWCTFCFIRNASSSHDLNPYSQLNIASPTMDKNSWKENKIVFKSALTTLIDKYGAKLPKKALENAIHTKENFLMAEILRDMQKETAEKQNTLPPP